MKVVWQSLVVLRANRSVLPRPQQIGKLMADLSPTPRLSVATNAASSSAGKKAVRPEATLPVAHSQLRLGNFSNASLISWT